VTTIKPPANSSRSKRQRPAREPCLTCHLTNHTTDTCYHTHPNWKTDTSINKKTLAATPSTSYPQIAVPPTASTDFDLFNYAHYGRLTSQYKPRPPSTMWIADSGASHHFCNNQDLISNYHDDPMPIHIGVGIVTSPGSGTVHMNVHISTGEFRPLNLLTVRYLPHGSVNTISEDILEKKDVYWTGPPSGLSTNPLARKLHAVKRRGA
jgi:hypothetical protein